jgi:hypothetical protein
MEQAWNTSHQGLFLQEEYAILWVEELHIYCSPKTLSLRIVSKGHMEVTYGYNPDALANRRRLFRELQL